MPRYIDAEKLKRQMGLMPMDWNTRDEMWMRESDIACYIDTCPEADVVERKKGHWILSDDQWQGDVANGNYRFFCSECGKSDLHSKEVNVSFCWNCGAEMEESDDK